MSWRMASDSVSTSNTSPGYAAIIPLDVTAEAGELLPVFNGEGRILNAFVTRWNLGDLLSPFAAT